MKGWLMEMSRQEWKVDRIDASAYLCTKVHEFHLCFRCAHSRWLYSAIECILLCQTNVIFNKIEETVDLFEDLIRLLLSSVVS